MDKKLLDDYLHSIQEKELNEGVVVGALAVIYVIKWIRQKVKEAAEKAKKTAQDLYNVTSGHVILKKVYQAKIKAYKQHIGRCDRSTNPKNCREIINQEIKKLEKKLKDL